MVKYFGNNRANLYRQTYRQYRITLSLTMSKVREKIKNARIKKGVRNYGVKHKIADLLIIGLYTERTL